jgi:hypothetical protein
MSGAEVVAPVVVAPVSSEANGEPSPAIPLPANVQSLDHPASLQRIAFCQSRMEPPAGKSSFSLNPRHPFTGILVAVCTETGQTPSGTVDVVMACSHHANKDADPTFTLFTGAVLALTDKKTRFLAVVSRLFLPSCREDRLHFLALRLTGEGSLSDPLEWYVRKVKPDNRAIGHLNRDLEGNDDTWKQLKALKESGVEAKVVAGDLAEDVRREDGDAALKGKSSVQSQGGKPHRTPRQRHHFDPSQESSSPQTQKAKRQVDTEDTDTDSDVERKCSACLGVFNDSCREDHVRFKCRQCDPIVLLCGSCVIEHRAVFKGHRCKKQPVKKPKRTKSPKRKKGRVATEEERREVGGGGKSSAGDSADHESAPGRGRGMSDKAVVALYEEKRALFAPQQAQEAKVANLQMQIKIAELEKRLARAKSSKSCPPSPPSPLSSQ